MSLFSNLFKSAAQKQLDAYKPTAIRIVQDTAAKYEAQPLTHATALGLQTDLMQLLQKSGINPTLQFAIGFAIMQGVSEANVSLATGAVQAKFDYLTNVIVGKIQGARL